MADVNNGETAGEASRNEDNVNKSSPVQNILSNAIKAVESPKPEGGSNLVSSKWYGGKGSASASSSVSNLSSTTRRSKIPLPSAFTRDNSSPAAGTVSGRSTPAGTRGILRREGSSPPSLMQAPNGKPRRITAPPPVPPKPKNIAKPLLRREISSPPSLQGDNRIKREPSFDSLSGRTTPGAPASVRSTSSSRIPVWKGSQERLNNFSQARKKWESCSNLEVKTKTKSSSEHAK